MSSLFPAFDLAPTALAVLGLPFLLKTAVRPWWASRTSRQTERWWPAVLTVGVAVLLAAAALAAWLPGDLPWRPSAIVWHALAACSTGVAIAVAAGVQRRGRHGARPRLQQAIAIAWLVLVPLTWQWDRATRHHHTAPPEANDVRASQLRPLTADELGTRNAGTRPPAGQCTLQASQAEGGGPVLLATYGRGVGGASERLATPGLWRERSATLIGFGDGQLGLQDNTGLVRRTGWGWQLDVPPSWTREQVEAAHDAERAERARLAERSGREAAWRHIEVQRSLLATTPPDPNAEAPLRLHSDSSFDRFDSPVVQKALAAAQLNCARSTQSRSGWQCTSTSDGAVCPVQHLSELCPVVGRRVVGDVLNLQEGVAPTATGSDTAWFLFRARPAACVLMSRRLSDAGVRAASGPGLVTCDPSPADPSHPVPVLTAELAYPTETERSRLDDRARDLRAAYDQALRAPRAPSVEPLPRRIDALTESELACDPAQGPCRRFQAHLVSDGTPLVIEERCSDDATAAAQSRFADPFFKR